MLSKVVDEMVDCLVLVLVSYSMSPFENCNISIHISISTTGMNMFLLLVLMLILMLQVFSHIIKWHLCLCLICPSENQALIHDQSGPIK